MRSKNILYIIPVVIILLVLFGFFLYKISKEKYKTLRNVGVFPIEYQYTKENKKQENGHKYTGILYKHNRRYNFLAQRNAGQML